MTSNEFNHIDQYQTPVETSGLYIVDGEGRRQTPEELKASQEIAQLAQEMEQLAANVLDWRESA